jgi:hypothetical protein
MPITVKCYTNCDDAFIVWKLDEHIPGLRGFALARNRKDSEDEEIVETWVGPACENSEPGEHRPSTVWPIQKFQWTDYLVRSGDVVRYRIIPMTGSMCGDNAGLSRRDDLASEWTGYEKVGPYVSKRIAVFFNRGIVASQWLSRRLGAEGIPLNVKSRKLDKVVETAGDKTRNFLGGPLRAALYALLMDAQKAKKKLYAALYELDDVELLPALADLKKKANIVLANGSVKKKGEDQNKEARAALKGVVNLTDRMISPTALGHNKFLVFCDQAGKPEKVWTGSTNLTNTGICTQANNGILINDAKVADLFKKQYEILKKSKSDFPAALVNSNSTPTKFKVDGAKMTVWFTRTSEQQDLDQARDLINGAKKAILFLMFNPGPAGTLLNTIIERQSPASPNFNPLLYTHGVLNQDPSTVKNPVVGLFHRGEYETAPFSVTLPAAVDERLNYWLPTLLKKNRAWAMVHSKVIVLDPFSEHPVVMTGSHNLGPKASGKNDENFLIVENHPKLAAAYAVTIMSIYTQYRWRFSQTQLPDKPVYQGTADNDTWQDDYAMGAKAIENDFWLGL